MAIFEKVRAAEDDAPTAAAVDLAALSAVAVTVGQLSAARDVLGSLAQEWRWDWVARQAALCAGLDEPDIAIAAIDARLLAARKWEDIHDPDRVLDQSHVMDAATLAPLLETEHGVGFSDTTFGELVDFVAELPW